MTNEDKSKEQLLDEIKELKQNLAKAKKLDKSRLKDAHKEIEKSHSEYSLLFNNMTAGVAIHEMLYDDNGKPCDYRFLQVNPAFEKMTGVKTDKLIGKRVKEVMPKTEEYWIEKFGKVAKTGKMESFQNYSSELNKYYDVCAFSPKKDFFAVTIINVTERILAEKKLLASNQQIMAANQQLSASEQQLRAANQQLSASEQQLRAANQQLSASEQQLIAANQQLSASEQQLRAANQQLVKSEIKNQSILENSPVCTKIVDLDFNLQYMSNAGVKALHIDDITEFYGKPYPLSFYPDSSIIPMTKSLKEAKEKGKITIQEVLAVDMNGNDLWFHSTFIPVYDYNNKLDYIMVVSLETTERMRAEENLKRALEKAQESDCLKSAFLANMSHEIRTPMNGILGFIELLNTPELSDEKKQEFTKIIKKSSDRLLNTINDLIDISKIEAKQVGISNSEVNVNELLKELYDFFTPAIEAKGLSLISLPVSAKNQTTVFTDDDKLHGILRNLVNNAIKHTDKGSISYGYTLKDKYIEFFVKDTGIGVAKNRHKAIFDRFVQADIEDARAFEGSGLGLAIAKAYVEMMGGKIWLESEEGKGTEFFFTIPYKNNINKEIDSKSKTAKNTYIKKTFKDMTVLIADDDNITSLYYDAILQSKFQKIIYVKNGKEAIEAVKNNSDIDIILMDIKMPKIDGYEATQKIRTFNKDIIIISQTAYALEGEKEKAFKAGCDDYLSKPINEEKLFKTIENILNKKK